MRRVRFAGALPAGLLAAGTLLAVLLAGPAQAVNPGERLDDPALEARARDLSRELRCVVCQNQSIDDSDADLAKDLRLLVRERITAGDTDDEVMRYLTDRYGDFVRLRPPLNAATVALWALPAVVLLIALAAAVAYLRRRPGASAAAPAPLSAEEEADLAAALAERSDAAPPAERA